MPEFASGLVESMVVGHSFAKAELQEFVLQNYRATRYRDVLHIECEKGEFWLFDYGVLICWGVLEAQKQALLSRLGEFVINPLPAQEFEQYHFVLNADTDRMHTDQISLVSDEHWARLAVSHALAQSVKLGQFESSAQAVIEANAYIPRALATTGKIPLKRRELSRLRGTLFSVKSDILLNFNLLDTPEFFWDYSELEPLYTMVSRYLDIVSRINVLSKKMETIHELFEMLASEQHHLHSSMLEWIIIILIAVEIGLFFWH